MRFAIRQIFETDPQGFWAMFFDEAYNRALFEKHLGFLVYRVLEIDRRDDGSIVRKVECAPPVEVPAVARKVIGDTTSYVEEGRFDPKAGTFTVEVKPKVGADRIKTHVVIRVEPRGAARCERIAEIDNTVSVFGVGKVIEAFIERQTRDTYRASDAFSARWLAGERS